MIGPLNVAAEYVDRISKGDIPPRITDEYKGDFNEIKNNLNTCIDAVNLLVKDAKMLATAAVEGKLDTRADANKHQGDFRGIVQGVNSTLDNVIGPLNVAAEYVDRISKGDIPPRITDAYNGDFNEIKNNLNTCIDAVNLLVKDAKSLVTAAVEGKLDTRADASKHQGDVSLRHFESVKRLLSGCGVEWTVNPRLVRGLDYYSHTVFEFLTSELGAQGTLCGGGRYDGLFEVLGGKPTPAVGWGMGIERVLELLKEQGTNASLPTVDAYAIIPDAAAFPVAMHSIQVLRRAGVSVQMHAGTAEGMGSMKSQFKRADSTGAQFALIFGADELANGQVMVKSLRDGRGEQQPRSLDTMAQWASTLQLRT